MSSGRHQQGPEKTSANMPKDCAGDNANTSKISGDNATFSNNTNLKNLTEEMQNVEFEELDSSAEFHEWEKRQRAITPEARIRKKSGESEL